MPARPPHGCVDTRVYILFPTFYQHPLTHCRSPYERRAVTPVWTRTPPRRDIGLAPSTCRLARFARCATAPRAASFAARLPRTRHATHTAWDAPLHTPTRVPRLAFKPLRTGLGMTAPTTPHVITPPLPLRHSTLQLRPYTYAVRVVTWSAGPCGSTFYHTPLLFGLDAWYNVGLLPPDHRIPHLRVYGTPAFATGLRGETARRMRTALHATAIPLTYLRRRDATYGSWLRAGLDEQRFTGYSQNTWRTGYSVERLRRLRTLRCQLFAFTRSTAVPRTYSCLPHTPVT